MLKNYLKVAIRNIAKNGLSSAINILGLAMGITCSLFVIIYIAYELSYDRFHEDHNRIYRVVSENYVVCPGPVATVLENEFPQVNRAVRMYAQRVWGRSGLISYGANHFYSDGVFMVDPSFLDVFSFRMIAGNPENALDDLSSIVITQEMAEKYFGRDNPLGKTLVYENQYNYTVTGVIEKAPGNSHFKFDFLLPLENYRDIRSEPNGLEQWYNSAFVTYVLLNERYDIKELEREFASIVKEKAGEDYGLSFTFQPMTSIHLQSHLRRELEANSHVRYIYMFSVIGLLVLVMACVNFMNLSTVRSAGRLKEIGMRKVVGARRGQLIRQFLGESVVASCFALILSIIAFVLLYRPFNIFTGIDMGLDLSNSLLIGAAMLFIVMAVGLVAGGYPALFLSGFRPVKALKDGVTATRFLGVGMIRLLVILQFGISIGLTASALIVSGQMKFIQNKNLGFDSEQVLVVPTRRSEEVVAKVDVFKQQALGLSGIRTAAASSQTPGNGLFRRSIHAEGHPDKDQPSIYTLWTDRDFIKTYQIEVLAGRDFSQSFGADESSTFILNETAVAMLGGKTPEEMLGKKLSTDGKKGQVIGVVKDFHFMSLHDRIEPIVMHIDPSRYYDLSMRIATEGISGTIASLQREWKVLFPNRPFEFSFLDDEYQKQYESEARTGQLFNLFSGMAIFIAALGLFGLASYIVKRKTREIGIRKVLGAGVPALVVLLTREFSLLVVLSNFIAVPVVYFFMSGWLDNFAYHISIGADIFVFAGFTAVVVAWLTVGSQALKASLANPVNALRYE